jgi:hypothetical protein
MKKVTLTNTTVKTYVNTNGQIEFLIYKGKGNGSSLISCPSMEDAKLFDNELSKLEYKIIFKNGTKSRGGAYFYKGTTKMFSKTHPFLKAGFTI